MHLDELRITNCFGFADATISFRPTTTTILGRNSSGKTALLDAINHLAPERVPNTHPRFENFHPTDKKAQLSARFKITETPQPFDATKYLKKVLLHRGISAHLLNQHEKLEENAAELDEIYKALAARLTPGTTLRITKLPNGSCQLTINDDWDDAKERRATITRLLQTIFPGNVFTAGNTRHDGISIDAADLDQQASSIMPPIAYFNERFSLIDDIPDHLTAAMATAELKPVTDAFLWHLGANDVSTLLTTNDPDEQDRLRGEIQARADNLTARINKESHELLKITISPTPRGLQITMRTDGKPTFYRLMSDATKFLFAYHLHAEVQASDGILLFDEPTKGLHPSAERTMRDFLTTLAEEHQVIVATHSERLIDTDHLDQIRLMQQDREHRPVVLNALRPPRERKQYLLALQPVFDAIGLPYAHQTTTCEKVILTEGLTDFLYVRGIHHLARHDQEYNIAPGRGESTFFTLIPFFISQRVALKMILDHPALLKELQESLGVPTTAVHLIPTSTAVRGIEDLFSTNAFLHLLADAGIRATTADLARGNSAYAKTIDKRHVAHTFLKNATKRTIDEFDEQTRQHMNSILAFCDNDAWFTL